jgi:branched-chain amino acid aminotransferase
MPEIKVTKAEPKACAEKPADESKLGFGRHFTDHMFMLDYAPGKGWHDGRIVPRRPLSLDPAAMVLHYSQEAFEGLKAYRGKGGGIYLFRYRDNIKRLLQSSERLCIPAFDEEVLAEGIRRLVLLDRDWIPCSEGCSLYIRPNVIATDPFLGVRPSDTYLLYVITGPVGAYYPEGFNPVSIYATDTYVRAVRGGTGAAKTGGNYAASLAAQAEAKRRGFTQVLWLDAIERKYVEEVGTMNLFFVLDGTVVTSPLTGTVLPGITRDSVLRICRDWGKKVEERLVSIDEVCEGARSGRLAECFGSGTAAIISPVGSMHHKGEDYRVGDGKTGPLSLKLYEYLLKMQYGHAEDPYGWVERIDR